MVVLRPTRKLSTLLPATTVLESQSDTALGDWYVNRVVVDRRPLLLLVSSASLLPMLLPARDVRSLPHRLADLVAVRLRRFGVAPAAIEAERGAMKTVAIAPTLDRSVVGIMVDFAKVIPDHLDAGQWDDTTLAFVEAQLARTPCHAGKHEDQVVFPDRKAPALGAARWDSV